MSTTHHETEPTSGSTVEPAAAAPAARVPGQRPGETTETTNTARRPVLIGLAIVVALALVAGIVVVALSMMHKPKHSATSAVDLPATVSGLAVLPVANDPVKTEHWQTRAKAALGTAPLGAQTYGSATGGRTIRVVAARTDLTGKLEQAWAVDAGHETDGAHCTQNVRLVEGGKAGIRPTVMLCWRVGSDLSAYTVIIDPKVTVKEADGLAALTQVWDAVS